HHALRLARGHVRHLERDGGAGARRGAGAVDAREDEGGPPDREPPRDGARVALPGAREEVHPGHRGADQVLGRLRRPPHALGFTPAVQRAPVPLAGALLAWTGRSARLPSAVPIGVIMRQIGLAVVFVLAVFEAALAAEAQQPGTMWRIGLSRVGLDHVPPSL